MLAWSAPDAGAANASATGDAGDWPTLAWSALPVGRLACPPAMLDLAHTLDCGQSFRWRRDADGTWIGVVGARVVQLWRDDRRDLRFRAWPWDGAEPALIAYLRLEVDLAALARELVERDPAIAPAFAMLPGLRVLGQPPEEALLTFVCSAANNVTRITRAVAALARGYGRPIAMLDGETHWAFPQSAALVGRDAAHLAATAGLGFRGRNLCAVAGELVERGPGWLDALALASFEDARAALQRLPSIGPKIADCVALFGLGHDRAVPVDTHVWGIARDLFGERFRNRTLTPLVYDQVRLAFEERYGRWAGWAQQYLFHARRLERALPMPSEVRLIGA